VLAEKQATEPSKEKPDMFPSPIRRLVRASRKYEPTWRYAYNLMPTLNQRFHQHPLAGEAARVLSDLDRNGIAVTSVEALLSGSKSYTELVAAVRQLQGEKAAEIASARASAAEDTTIGKKTFLLEYLGRKPLLEPAGVFARFALQSPILDIANAYLGMYTRMRYYNIWHTFATTSKPRESQLWHRDREDLYIVKVFLYLNDVDLGAGPFTYAPGTHRKGPIQQDPAYFTEGGVKRTEDQQMATVVSQDKWITAVGRAGSIVFADTNGYHRGGLARTSDRIVYTCMFTSPTSQSEEFFIRPEYRAAADRDAAAFALR
jgi:hypothetical protein